MWDVHVDHVKVTFYEFRSFPNIGLKKYTAAQFGCIIVVTQSSKAQIHPYFIFTVVTLNKRVHLYFSLDSFIPLCSILPIY